MILVIGWSLLRGNEDGLLWAVIGGLSLDFLSAAPFGIFTFTMLIVVFVTNLIHGRTFGSSIVLPLSLTFPLSLLFNGLALLFRLGLLELWQNTTESIDWGIVFIDWGTGFVSVLVPAAIVNTVLMVLIFPLLYLLNRWLHPEPLSF